MRLTKLLVSLSLVLTVFRSIAQTAPTEINYFIGTGTDTAYFIVDFKDSSPYASDSSYAWGVLFTNSISGEGIVSLIDSLDMNFTASLANGFLNDISYGEHKGIGGAPDYWSTWSGQDTSSLSLNSGLSTVVSHNDWFALSYTDFNPAAKPGLPIAAWNGNSHTIENVTTWLGQGSDSSIFIIDFNQGDSSYFEWGFLYNDSIKAADVLIAIDSAEIGMTINMSSFLNDIIFNSYSGIGGSPDYWGSWSASNIGNWHLNSGLGEYLKNGDYFGVSYTDFSPALRPRANANNLNTISVLEFNPIKIRIYPNPTTEGIYIDSHVKEKAVIISQLNGKVTLETEINSSNYLDLNSLIPGVYILNIDHSSVKIIKE